MTKFNKESSGPESHEEIGWHQYDEITPDLPFEMPEQNLASQVRASLSRTIHASRRSIDEIAAGLSQRLGLKITKHILRNMSAECHQGHRFPLEWAAAWVEETGDSSLLKVLLGALHLPLPKRGDARKIRFAEARIMADLAAQEADGLKAQILRSKR